MERLERSNHELSHELHTLKSQKNADEKTIATLQENVCYVFINIASIINDAVSNTG